MKEILKKKRLATKRWLKRDILVAKERFEKGRAKERLEKDGVKGGFEKKFLIEWLERKIDYIF